MSTSVHLDQVDITKDYYQALGLPHTASIEELKAAYVTLAMQYHPDTLATKNIDESTKRAHHSQFIQISEAYGVLSRPETRLYYDTGRSRLLGRNFGSISAVQASATETVDHRIISESYNTQRMNFTKVQGRASSNWRDLQDKYKSEKWQNMPLNQRKVNRAVKVHGIGSSAIVAVAPIVFLAGLTYVAMS